MNQYLHLTRDLKKKWNMKVSIILIIFGTQQSVLNDLEKRLAEFEIRGRMETIQTTELYRSASILETFSQ